MIAFSILEVPTYLKKKLLKKCIGVHVDYKRFNIKHNEIFWEIPLLLKKANDTDNSNMSFDGEVSFLRVSSPRWIAHQVIVAFIGIWPVAICYIEQYWNWQGLQWSKWRIDFYGAFFHFMDFIPDRYIRMYKKLCDLAELKKWVNVTRIDIACDFDFEFPQSGDNWIRPCKNSKRDVYMYKTDGKKNSFWYLSSKNSWYGVRIYNKKVDIMKNGKEKWYWGEKCIPKNWTRIEFEFYPPYSKMSDEELMKLCYHRITWDIHLELWMKFRPILEFSVENAYNYFERYAKSHWISIETLIDEIMWFHIYIEEKKEIYWLTE